MTPGRNPTAMPHHYAPEALREHYSRFIAIQTRQEALQTGALIQAPEDLAQAAHFTAPVAISYRAWNRCVKWTDADRERSGQTFTEHDRLRSVLVRASRALMQAARTRERYTRLGFEVEVASRPEPGDEGRVHARRVALYVHIGIDAQLGACVTITLPGAD